MRYGRNGVIIAGLALVAGCNRQDADALGKIGQILVQRGKALSQSAKKSKIVPAYPLSLEGPNRERNSEGGPD